jgi:archaemetzincin
MTRVWIIAMLACCGGERTRDKPRPAVTSDAPAAPPSTDPRIAAIGDHALVTPELRRALDPDGFVPTGTPEPGDWLAEHPEKPQTFDDYLQSHFHMPTEQRGVIYLLPLGTFPPEAPQLASLEAIVRAFYTLDVRVLPAVPIADVTATKRINANTGKRQLLAPDILAWMKKRVPADAYAVMALTMEDLYPEESWNVVFGMASLHDRVGVQSFARQDPAFFGDDRTPGWQALALRRATWTVIHEVAHMFGLSHCVHYQCIVAGSNSQDESDRAPLHPCPVCLHKLWWAIRFDPAARESAVAKALVDLGIADEAAWSERRARWIRDGTR